MSVLVDSYSESNAEDVVTLSPYSLTNPLYAKKYGEAFRAGTGGYLESCKFYLSIDTIDPESGITPPAGPLRAELWAATGIFGTSMTASGTFPLAVSDPVYATALSDTPDLYTFTFTGGNSVPMNDDYYIIALDYGSDDGNINIWYQINASSYPGNKSRYYQLDNPRWKVESGDRLTDLIFYVYQADPVAEPIPKDETLREDTPLKDLGNSDYVGTIPSGFDFHQHTPEIVPTGGGKLKCDICGLVMTSPQS